MKTFKDLFFEVHRCYPALNTMAVMNFDNGYGISVITGKTAYSDETHPYEVAVLKDDEICYDTPITDDVIGYCTADMVTDLMCKIQNLQPYEKK